MNSKIEQIYFKFPEILQNAAINILGYRENLLRYSGIYPDFYRDINKNIKISNKELEQIQESQLKKIIYNEASEVPYYKELFKKVELPDEKNFRLSDLNLIPFLTKEIIREQSDILVKKDTNKKMLTLHTTGTTGTPLKIFCTAEVRQKNYAFFSRFLNSVGIDPNGIKATIGGRLVVESEKSKPPFWKYSIFQKCLYMSSYHLNDRNIDYYINILKKMKPSYIDAYPSSIYTIADYASRKKVSLNGITKAIVTSSETLYPIQRKLIEEKFGVPVFDQYGAVEMCVFIAQCRNGNYHLHSDYSYVELLNENGKKAGPGQEAEIVCTGFINSIMPLIRYKINDKVELPSSDKQACECGSNFPIIKRILGRADDVILTPDGRKIGRLSPVLKGFPIREAQYRQYMLNAIEVLIVKDTGYSEITEGKIVEAIKKRTGPYLKIKIKYVDSIERGKGGKMRSVISFLKEKQ